MGKGGLGNTWEMKQDNRDMQEDLQFASPAEKHTFYRKAWALILPMALQNLINVGVTATDIILLGKVGETVLSGYSARLI